MRRCNAAAGVKLSAMSAACGPYCMSCGMSEATMAMKINTWPTGIDKAEIDEAEDPHHGAADHVHFFATNPAGDMSRERDGHRRKQGGAKHGS